MNKCQFAQHRIVWQYMDDIKERIGKWDWPNRGVILEFVWRGLENIKNHSLNDSQWPGYSKQAYSEYKSRNLLLHN